MCCLVPMLNLVSMVIAADKAAISEKTFNLAGQQVSNGFRGIVVKNGKKFIK